MTTLEKLEPSILYNDDGSFFALAYNNLHNDYSVYKLTCPDGRIYIGICAGKPERRWRNGDHYNSRMKSVYDVYPFDTFKKELLFTGLSEEVALEKEQELIAEYDSADPSKGFNVHQSSRSSEYCYYILTFPNGKKYVGLSKVPVERRWECARTQAYRKNARLYAAIQEYGWENVQKEVYYDQLTLSSARNLETTLIIALRTCEEAFGYNLTYGSAWNELMVRPGDQSFKFSPVRCIDTGEEFDSIKSASAATGANAKSISEVCRGHRKSAGGFSWEYVQN